MKKKGQTKASKAAPHAPTMTRGKAGFSPVLDWGGVRIVVPPSVRVRRLLPGGGSKATPVEMDLRAFVPSNSSSVVDRWIHGQIEARKERADWLNALLETRATPGWFDTTAHLVADIVFEQIKYRLRNGGAWQLAEETLALGAGDCEDRATLLASSLVAAGISPYNVRVALGQVALRETKKGSKLKRVAHAWVVYRGENGSWVPLEPVPLPSDRKHSSAELTYEPDYVFNGDHQWMVNIDEDPQVHERWNALDPSFHGEVHKSIVEHAAAEAKLPGELRSRISRMFTGLAGHIIDKPDLNVRAYDPRDHFDSGLIDQSWQTVVFRLDIFYKKPLGDAEGLVNACFAAHAIADFYAHSTYAHFLDREKPGQVTHYDPVSKQPALAYDYASDPVFSKLPLTTYTPWYKPTDFDRYTRWKGRPISGRYSLRNDSHDAIEAVTNEPSNTAVPAKLRGFVGSLPHHNEIAVDEDGEHSNELYAVSEFKRHFALRYHLALRHITDAFLAHPGAKT